MFVYWFYCDRLIYHITTVAGQRELLLVQKVYAMSLYQLLLNFSLWFDLVIFKKLCTKVKLCLSSIKFISLS